MTKPTGTGFLRSHTRAANHPSPNRRAEQALQRLATAVVDAEVAKDADRAQAWLKAQAAASLHTMSEEK